MKSLQYHLENRHATWLELFFDLVFVASIGIVTHNLAHTHDGHISTAQLFYFPIEFLPLWWIWATHTLYVNRFYTNSKNQRFATLAIMFLIVSMSAFLGEALFEHYERFIGFYVAIRVILAGMFWRAVGIIETSNLYARLMAIRTLVAAFICGSSIFFESPLRESILIGGIFIEIIAAILINIKSKVDPIHRGHLVERIGLLSIILLGESVISLVAGLSNIEWNIHNVTAAITGFILIGSIWWIYFGNFHIMEHFKSLKFGYSMLLSHIFLSMGLVILANLIGHAILGDLNVHDFRILAAVGMTFFYIGKQVPYFVHVPVHRKSILINSVVCIAITLASTFLPRPEYVLIGMTLGMFFYIYSSYKWTLSKDASAYLA
jgi:low temperature requirement protein LtrA